MRNFLRDPVRYPGDRNAAETVANKNDVCELFAFDDLSKVLCEGGNGDVLGEEVRPVPHTRITGRVDKMALSTELVGHALPAPPTVPRAVCQDECFLCSLRQREFRRAHEPACCKRKANGSCFQQISARQHDVPPRKLYFSATEADRPAAVSLPTDSIRC